MNGTRPEEEYGDVDILKTPKPKRGTADGWPTKIYVELEDPRTAGEYLAPYFNPEDIDLEPGEETTVAIYELKTFIKVQHVSKIEVTEIEEGQNA